MFKRFSKFFVFHKQLLAPYRFSKTTSEILQDFRKFSSTVKTTVKNDETSSTNDNFQTKPKMITKDLQGNELHFENFEDVPSCKTTLNPFYDIEEDYKNYDPTDVPHFIDDIEPVSGVSFNLAAYVNNSPTLQKLVELGTDLSKIETKPEHAKFLMNLDFETNIKPYIQFLHDKLVPAEDLGFILTKNIMLLVEDLENLQIRINYLQSKKFSDVAIARIISKNPFHLMHDTKFVDKRLGFLQKTFDLTGDEVRFLITKYPKLVSYHYDKIMDRIFVLKDLMGFEDDELKQLLLMKPKIWTISRKNIEDRFDILHHKMGLSHQQILNYPGLFLKRGFLLQQRHQYLDKLGRAQYNPKKPGYIPLKDIATTTDSAFCKLCAKTSVDEYNEFLKTL